MERYGPPPAPSDPCVSGGGRLAAARYVALGDRGGTLVGTDAIDMMGGEQTFAALVRNG